MRVWRRFQQIGAVAVKNAAYALPENETTLEDFTWLRQEILDAGGGALLLRAQGLVAADQEIEQLFRDERDQEYRKLAHEAEALRAPGRTRRISGRTSSSEWIEACGSSATAWRRSACWTSSRRRERRQQSRR